MTDITDTTAVREAREFFGLTVQALADELGTNIATISRLERGKTLSDRELIRGVHEYYDGAIPLQWVYDPMHEDAPTKLTTRQREKLTAVAEEKGIELPED